MHGGEIGFDWVCFFGIGKGVCFYNLFLDSSLGSFWHLANWVCFLVLRMSYFAYFDRITGLCLGLKEKKKEIDRQDLEF